MNLLFYDYETSDMVDWHKPSHMPHQPHIVTCTALLTDEAGRKKASLDLPVKPEGWEIAQEAFKTHRLTANYLNTCGLHESFVLAALLKLVELADLRIGHNLGFDERISRIACKRFKMGDPDEFKQSPQTFCTMRKSTKIVGLPPTDKMLRAGRKTNKAPNLEEAYEYFTGKKMTGSHQGMYDVMACRTVFFGILDADPSILPEIPRLERTGTLPTARGQQASASPAPAPAPAPSPSPAPEGTGDSADRLI